MSLVLAAATVAALAAMTVAYAFVLRRWTPALRALAALVPLSQCLLLVFYTGLAFQDAFFEKALWAAAALTLLCLVADAVALPFFRRAQLREGEEERARAAKAFADASERSAMLLREEVREAVIVRDAMVGQLREAARLIALGDKGELHARLENLNAPLVDARRFCAHRAADALLSLKASAAVTEGVAFSVVADIPDNLVVADADMCAVLSNMIDNALRGAASAEGADRFVDVRARMGGSMLAIEVSNGFAPVRSPRSLLGGAHRKARGVGEHGWGLEILQDIAAKYQGVFETGPKDGAWVWTASCLLKAR